MLSILSPAKTLDFAPQRQTTKFTEPELLDEAERLVGKLRGLSRPALVKLFDVSDEIAALNQERFQAWSRPFTAANAKQAILAFAGDVYTGLDAAKFKARDLAFAQQHLRILSGLYGVLRPLDWMQAYRLEMGTKLKTPRGKTLYDFWGDRITLTLERALSNSGSSVLVNLASNEYLKAVRTRALDATLVTPVFKEVKGGKSRVVATFAKRARGLMAAWIVKNRINDADELREFSSEAYRFQAGQSTDTEFVFSRPQPAPPKR
ncbi:MAG: peroxide stress protein YaaA [Planctomycetales bacterium]|nr:peroxide stress protein YaaA [Planctomycetales bacterium]